MAPGGTRYRRIGGNGPSVDESLFGEPMAKTRRSKGSSVDPSEASIILSRSELNKIKNTAVIKTERELMADREEAEAIRAEKERYSRARKSKMRELSEHSKKNAKKSDIEIANEARKAQLKRLGEQQKDRDSDVYKMLQSLSARAAAFTIRDSQLLDRKERERVEQEYDDRMDTIMEIDRLADLESRERIEKEKLFKRLDDRKVLIEQIELREKARVLAAEAREQEAMAIKARMDKYKDEDREAARLHQVEVEKSRIEVIKANEAAIAKKMADREAEKQAVRDILLYQAEQDAKLAAREAEEAAVEGAKKERQKKLLAMQEKSQNKQAELDELRARRAMEEKERIARRKERDEALKRRNDTKTLLYLRGVEAESKKKMQEEQKARDEQEYFAHLQHSLKSANRDADEARVKKENAYAHRRKLLKQIESDEERRERERGDNLDEGHRFRQQLIADEARFSTIRDQMIQELTNKGVNPSYLSEMRNVDIGKLLRR